MADEREVFFLIGRGGAILWSDVGESAVKIPDSRERWDAIWERRERVEELAHSHPIGPARFSNEDLTTMEALDSGLGKALRYSVVSPTGMVARVGHDGDDELVGTEPWWAPLLRRASGMPPLAPPREHDDCVEALRKTLAKQLGKRARIRVHHGADLTMRAADGEGEALLVVEVGDLHEERKKARAYARAQTLDYWIVDPQRRCVEVNRSPVAVAFEEVHVLRAGDVLSLVAFDEVSVCVDDIV